MHLWGGGEEEGVGQQMDVKKLFMTFFVFLLRGRAKGHYYDLSVGNRW
jgi:hypothetical protein